MKHTIAEVQRVNPEFHTNDKRINLYNDSFQNFKKYQIPKAQLIISDVPYCYDEQTECLTREGWKKYNEITLKDYVLSLNHETQEMCYSGIEDIIIRENNEDMYAFESNNINLHVSAKHRCYAKSEFVPNLKHGFRIRNRKRTTTNTNIRLADNITANCYIPRSGYVWKSNIMAPEYVIIPGCEIGKNKHTSYKSDDKKVFLDSWLRFFGLWISDGCTTRGGSTGYIVSIKQFGDNRNVVHDILKALPFDYSEMKEKNRPSSNFNIYSKQLYLYLLKFGKSTDKYIPQWILDLPTDKLKIFWDSYTFGDSTKNGEGLKISSVSKQLIQGLQEIALKLGVICQVRYQTHNTWPNGLYSFQFNPNSRNIKYAKKKIISDYKGNVWCLTLKTNSVFLVRRKGIITFSGNCLSNKAYASNPTWYVDGDRTKGESENAGEEFFDTDKNFKPAEFMHFCSQMLRPEPKEKIKSDGGGKKSDFALHGTVLFL